MTNRYRVVGGRVHLPGLTYEEGDEFDYEFSEADENLNVDSGLLEIVPRAYLVVGGSVVDGHQPGEIFKAALTVGREALLVAGGHIQRAISIAGRTDATKPTPVGEHGPEVFTSTANQTVIPSPSKSKE